MNSQLKRGAAATALIISVLGGLEGLRLYSYQDIIGIWTGCHGETEGMGPGLVFTERACKEMLIKSAKKHEAGMRACLKNPDAIPVKTYVAFLSSAYNFGVGTFCNGSIARLANEGDLAGACDALLPYDKVCKMQGGKRICTTIRGLTNRRQIEHKLCKQGLKQ